MYIFIINLHYFNQFISINHISYRKCDIIKKYNIINGGYSHENIKYNVINIMNTFIFLLF